MVLDVISEPSEDLLVGQTLKRSPLSSGPVEDRKRARKEEPQYNSSSTSDDDKYRISPPMDITDQMYFLFL